MHTYNIAVVSNLSDISSVISTGNLNFLSLINNANNSDMIAIKFRFNIIYKYS